MNSRTIGSYATTAPTSPTFSGSDGVVELGLLLPAQRAAALIRLAKERHESVGQILRKLIDRELAESY